MGFNLGPFHIIVLFAFFLTVIGGTLLLFTGQLNTVINIFSMYISKFIEIFSEGVETIMEMM